MDRMRETDHWLSEESSRREMGIFSNRVEKSELKAGDHIYSWRTAFTYSHHGIYMGEEKVVHFTQVQNSAFSSSVGKAVRRCSDCEALDLRNENSGAAMMMVRYRRIGGRVMMSCLDCFLAGGSLYHFEYNVSELSYSFKIRGGTCTTEESGPVEVVLERALHLLKNEFGEYNVFTNNCEDFARFCKTGQGCSRFGKAGRGSSQASSFLGTAAAFAAAFTAACGFSSSF